MDQIKIGRFIKECRLKKGLTQQELADKLTVSFKTISKWECGNGLPEVSLMVPLCELLGISVNELLNGEVIAENDKSKEEILLELVKQKEENDKRLFMCEWVIGLLSTVVLLVCALLASLISTKEWVRVVIVLSGLIIAVVGYSFALKIEQVAGYYECKICHHKYVPTFKETLTSQHMGRTRYLKCPKCNKRSWSKKVISKSEE